MRRFLFFFLISLKTVGKQIVVYHSALTVLRSSNGMVATCPVQPKKQAIIFLEVLRERTTLVGLGSSLNTQTVDCCLLSGSYEYIQVSSPVTMLYMDFERPQSNFFNIS